MRIIRALPGTLGLLAAILVPAAAAVFNLAVGLSHLEGEHPCAAPTAKEETIVIGRYVSTPNGDDRIELAHVRPR